VEKAPIGDSARLSKRKVFGWRVVDGVENAKVQRDEKNKTGFKDLFF